MKDANINVRVEDWIYSEAKEMDLNFSEVIRAALISEIEKKRIKKIMANLDRASAAVNKIGMKKIVSEIRDMRENR
jgi:post-segregation antitoxin (ccd killing protein)